MNVGHVRYIDDVNKYFRQTQRSLGRRLSEPQVEKILSSLQMVSETILLNKSRRNSLQKLAMMACRKIRTPFSPKTVLLPDEIISKIACLLPFSELNSVIPLVSRSYAVEKHYLVQENLWHQKILSYAEACDFAKALQLNAWGPFFKRCGNLDNFIIDDEGLPPWKAPADDSMLEGLHFAPKLRSMTLFSCTQISNTGFREFTRLKPTLSSFCCKMPELNEIDVSSYTILTQHCTKLEHIEILANDLVVYSLSRNCPYLTSAIFDDESQISDAALLSLRHCKQLTTLSLTGIRSITEVGMIAYFETVSSLTSLDISKTNATDHVLMTLKIHCPQITFLNVKNNPGISLEGIVEYADGKHNLMEMRI